MPADNLDDIWGLLNSEMKKQEQTMVFSGSTTLSEATYNKMMQSMVVKFKRSPGAYSYHNVPPSIAEQFFACENMGQSAGKFFIKEIKNVYPFTKLNK